MRKIFNRLIVLRNRLVGSFFRILIVFKREGLSKTIFIVKNRFLYNGIMRNVIDNQNNEKSAPVVSIVIPVFNALSLTQGCIRSLSQGIKDIQYEILVVDNASTDDTPIWLDSECKNNPLLKVLTMEKNIGFGPAVNYGIRQSNGKFIVILNNDTIVTPGWLEHLLCALEKDPQLGIVSPVTNYVGEGPQIDKNAQNLPPDVDVINKYAESIADRPDLLSEPNRLVFFCVMLRRELIDIIGYLDEGYEKGNFEDDDYCLRARMIGYRLAIVRNAFVYHHGSATFKSNRISHSQYMEKNRIRFYKKAGRIATASRQFLAFHNVENRQISVILRTKDRSLLLRRALASLANQTFRDFEVVIINDGGEDVSNVVREFQPQFHIKYIYNEVSQGRTAAINIGQKESKGGWLSILDDDDILYPWHLESLFLASRDGSKKFVYSDYNRALFLDEKRNTPDILVGSSTWEYSREDLLVKNNIPIHTWLYAHDCAEQVGQWDESLDRMEDYDFLLRLSAYYPLHHVRKVTCEYRYYVNSSNSIYIDRHKTQEAYEKIFQRYPVDSYVLRIRRQEVLDMIHTQAMKISKIEEKIGTDFSREQATRDIIRLVAGL